MPWNGNSYKHVTLQKHHIFSGVILKDRNFSSGAVCPVTIVEWSEWFVWHWADSLCTTTFFKGWITENFVSDSSLCGVLWFWWFFWWQILSKSLFLTLVSFSKHLMLFSWFVSTTWFSGFLFPVFYSCRFLLEEGLRFSLPEWDRPGPKLCQPFVIV